MSAQLKDLYALQTVDLELAKAKKAMASLDDGTAKRRQVEAARKEAENQQRLLHEATAELRDKELSLKSVEAKKKSYQDKMYSGTVTNPKELTSMKQEVDMLDRNRSKLEDAILELLDVVEERNAAVTDTEAALKREGEELSAYLAELERDRAALATLIEELSARRESAAGEVNPDLAARYDRLRAKIGPVVVARVEGTSCGVCHVGLTTYTLRGLLSDQSVENCENCGRILYLEQQ